MPPTFSERSVALNLTERLFLTQNLDFLEWVIYKQNPFDVFALELANVIFITGYVSYLLLLYLFVVFI